MGPAPNDVDLMDTAEEAENEPEVGAIRVQIEQTRAELGETIEAIKEKLRPEHLTEQAREMVHDATVGRVQAAASAVREAVVEQTGTAVSSARDTARSAGATLSAFLRANRLIAMLTGIGILCLWIGAWLSARESSSG